MGESKPVFKDRRKSPPERLTLKAGKLQPVRSFRMVGKAIAMFADQTVHISYEIRSIHQQKRLKLTCDQTGESANF